MLYAVLSEQNLLFIYRSFSPRFLLFGKNTPNLPCGLSLSKIVNEPHILFLCPSGAMLSSCMWLWTLQTHPRRPFQQIPYVQVSISLNEIRTFLNEKIMKLSITQKLLQFKIWINLQIPMWPLWFPVCGWTGKSWNWCNSTICQNRCLLALW